jgi:hypothetical protein
MMSFPDAALSFRTSPTTSSRMIVVLRQIGFSRVFDTT